MSWKCLISLLTFSLLPSRNYDLISLRKSYLSYSYNTLSHNNEKVRRNDELVISFYEIISRYFEVIISQCREVGIEKKYVKLSILCSFLTIETFFKEVKFTV